MRPADDYTEAWTPFRVKPDGSAEQIDVVIAMYYRDHHPPHFHAIYGEHEAQVLIDGGELLGGFLPPRAVRLVREWAELHRAELEENWAKAEAHEPLANIEPLP